MALVLIPFLLFLAVSHVVDRVETERRLEPLRAAQAAASAEGQRIVTVSTDVGERWGSETGPREDRVRALLGSRSANRLLEAPYLALVPDGNPPRSAFTGLRCYYLGIQDGGGSLEVGQASGLLQLCYRGSEEYPVGSGFTTLPG